MHPRRLLRSRRIITGLNDIGQELGFSVQKDAGCDGGIAVESSAINEKLVVRFWQHLTGTDPRFECSLAGMRAFCADDANTDMHYDSTALKPDTIHVAVTTRRLRSHSLVPHTPVLVFRRPTNETELEAVTAVVLATYRMMWGRDPVLGDNAVTKIISARECTPLAPFSMHIGDDVCAIAAQRQRVSSTAGDVYYLSVV